MAPKDANWLLQRLATIIKHLRALIRRLITLGFRTSNLTCYELGHTWTPYCRQAVFDVFYSSLKTSLKIYSSVYLVTALLKQRKLDYYLNVVTKDILRSTAFLTMNAFTFMSAFCTWRKVMGFYFHLNVFICALPLSSCLIQIEPKSSYASGGYTMSNAYISGLVTSALALRAVEQPSRHGMLAMYTTNLALETLYNMLTARKLLPKVPYGEIFIFSSALAGFLQLYRVPGAVDGFTRQILSITFGSDELDLPTADLPTAPSPLAKVYTYLPQYIKYKTAQLMRLRCFTVKHNQCKHQWGCLLNVSEKFVRCFLMGFGISTALKVPAAIKLIFGGKNPFSSWILSGDNFSCGAFVAGMSSLHQLVSCLLRWTRGKTDSKVDGIISGAVAGLSMYFYRSSPLALYVFIRLIDLLCRRWAAEGKLPTVKHAYVYLYAFTTAVLFHAGVWEPHNIRPAYWKFMLNITGGKFAYVNRLLVDKVFDIESATLYPNFWPKYDPKFTSLTPEVLNQDVSRFIR